MMSHAEYKELMLAGRDKAIDALDELAEAHRLNLISFEEAAKSADEVKRLTLDFFDELSAEYDRHARARRIRVLKVVLVAATIVTAFGYLGWIFR